MLAPAIVIRIITTLRRWYQLHCSRRALLRLNREQLKDIGLSRRDALNEAEKPFWRG